MQSENNSKYYLVLVQEVMSREILVEAGSKNQAEQRAWEMFCDDLNVEDNCEIETRIDAYTEISKEDFERYQGYDEIEEYVGESGGKWKRRV